MARPTLFSNRKFLKLATRLQSEALALGHLEFLWHAANENGNPVIGGADDVEAVARWRGARGELVAALMECGSENGAGFIEINGTARYEIHDYWHHAPAYASGRRGKEEERQREKICDGCERKFFSADPRARFCSHACRSRGYRDRRRDGTRDGDHEKRDASSGIRHANVTDVTQRATEVVTQDTDRVTQVRHALRTVTDRDGTPAPAPAPVREDPPPPQDGGPGSLTRSKRRPRDARTASSAAWGLVIEGSARAHQRAEIERADPLLVTTVQRLGGWSKFGHSTAIGTLKAPFRELYEQLLEQQRATA